ncbi:hypothetical protein EV361DRAFT_806437 [Lentinula raphanica]|nr:hypothetical protein EV361DRAFT_806437 [Lentinula raphanica]
MDVSLSSAADWKSGDCQIMEIIQYNCELELSQTENPVIRCFPLSRMFRICSGRPGVELTRSLTVNEDGVVELPTNIK